ncbi:uncharacterized protein L969DRAFT_48896 [Mixia osmundae IAM 14324]|uniref:Uncharacterized protein n=1 Tax=Mixia osmundae (strain CBS 9802 / IAM 14324 / JCM 22182 / KY 12970) TaxID=764103 RepID=G7E446_MIXOS|nr:uncharacterized protein L969DRAFT_48896 [Mixia osmundae IAM 14324]KEI39701.1 hypothetical protein L969DRAFT_48896 [Mixia osmundae IAM 14324]GAA97606.1 hypothetical protein E5Q_04284 [Mixia osmundae IAM 14324]
MQTSEVKPTLQQAAPSQTYSAQSPAMHQAQGSAAPQIVGPATVSGTATSHDPEKAQHNGGLSKVAAAQPINAVPITQQPRPMGSMLAANHNVQGLPRDVVGKRAWTFGLCSRRTLSSCCLPCLCPCIVYGQVQGRYDALKTTNQPSESNEAINPPCLLWCLLSIVIPPNCIFLPNQRAQVASRYDIRIDGVNEIVLSLCCTPCVLSQTDQELRLEETALRAH